MKNDRFLGFFRIFLEGFFLEGFFWEGFSAKFHIKLETLFKNLTLANFLFFIFI